jgi:ankyrin repeat protein
MPQGLLKVFLFTVTLFLCFANHSNSNENSQIRKPLPFEDVVMDVEITIPKGTVMSFGSKKEDSSRPQKVISPKFNSAIHPDGEIRGLSIDGKEIAIQDGNLKSGLFVTKEFGIFEVFFVRHMELLVFATDSQIEQIRKWLEAPTKASTKNFTSQSLFVAVKSNNPNQVKEIIENGIDVDARNFNNETSLHMVVCYKDLKDIAKLLIENGANIDATNSKGETPLHLAIDCEENEIAELLINNGADVHAKDNSGDTPLHKSVIRNKKEIVELLIEKGADVNVINYTGISPLQQATENNFESIALLLQKHGASE